MQHLLRFVVGMVALFPHIVTAAAPDSGAVYHFEEGDRFQFGEETFILFKFDSTSGAMKDTITFIIDTVYVAEEKMEAAVVGKTGCAVNVAYGKHVYKCTHEIFLGSDFRFEFRGRIWTLNSVLCGGRQHVRAENGWFFFNGPYWIPLEETQ